MQRLIRLAARWKPQIQVLDWIWSRPWCHLILPHTLSISALRPSTHRNVSGGGGGLGVHSTIALSVGHTCIYPCAMVVRSQAMHSTMYAWAVSVKALSWPSELCSLFLTLTFFPRWKMQGSRRAVYCPFFRDMALPWQQDKNCSKFFSGFASRCFSQKSSDWADT